MNIPIAQHCDSGAVLLRTVDPSLWRNRWLLVRIRWEDHPHHPGEYIIEFNTPLHDGYLKSKFFAKWPVVEKKWDEYEPFILEWVNSLRGVEPLVEPADILLEAWRMFVYIYDSWFMKQDQSLKELNFRSLFKENSISDRYESYQKVAMFLSAHYPHILRDWKYEVLSQVQRYSVWLAELIQQRCTPLLKSETQ